MKCDRALLSSYLDNDLTAAERQRLETHLTECSDCLGVLESFRVLRFQVRDEAPMRAPRSIRANVEARMHARRRQEQLRWLPAAVGAPVGLVAMLAVGALLAPRFEPGPQLAVTATSPALGDTQVTPTGAVELWFDRELNVAVNGVTVTVDPPLPVRVSIDGNALRIEPDTAFEPGQQYTVAVESVTDVDGRRLRAPVVVSFATAPVVVAEAPRGPGSPRGDAFASTSEDTPRETISHVGKAAASLSAVGPGQVTITGASVDSAVSTTQTRKSPSSRGVIAAPLVEPPVLVAVGGESLGALLAPAQSVRALEQAFQGGIMIKLGSSSQTFVLQRQRSTWTSLADVATQAVAFDRESLPPPAGALAPSGVFGALWQETPSVRGALGWAVYEPRVAAAVVQRREHGLAVTLGRVVYLLRADGTWSVEAVSRG